VDDRRATLIVNPVATTTSPELRDLIAAALGGSVALDVHLTTGRGHATELAASAVDRGDRAVIVLAGDGTINEAVQALAGTATALGIVPGGGANVLVRALDLPAEPVTAAARLLGALREDRRRRIGLGRAGERLFTFAAGLGFDAAVVHRVEEHPLRKRRLRHAAYVLGAIDAWRDGPHAGGAVRVEVDGVVTGPFTLALVGNTSPWSTLGPVPLVVHPGASFDRGLDLLTVAPTGFAGLAAVVAGALAGGRHLALPGVDHRPDLAALTLRSDVPLPLQVDGDPLAATAEVAFTAVPDALDVLA
jgi:diacylglycerol kinase family enzyme